MHPRLAGLVRAAQEKNWAELEAQLTLALREPAWLPGQVSPVHGHQVWCAFGVAEDELTEEQFDHALGPSKTTLCRAGDLADRDLHGKIIHRVANRGRAPLVSLHLYGVAAERLTTGINRFYE